MRLGRAMAVAGWLGAFCVAGFARGAEPSTAAVALPPDLRTRSDGEDWPTFLGPRHNSTSAERGLKVPWPADGPPIRWQHRLGVGYSMPTISRGRLFQFESFGPRAQLTCLESETGKLLWKFDYPSAYQDLYGYDAGPRTSPVVDDDRVYLFGVEGMLHCLRVSDGSVVWKLDTAAQFGVVQNFFGVGSTPLVEGELLIVPVGGSPPDDQKIAPGRLDLVTGNGSGIVAFDKHTGAVRYQLTDELASYASPVPATIGGRRWCFVFARGGLVGFEPGNGRVEFQVPWRASILESVNASNPVVVDERVFISETYGPGSALLRVRPGGCDVVWSDAERRRGKAMQTHWNTVIHHQGYLYGSSGRHTEDAELRCIALETGEVQWSEPGLSRSSLLYVDEHFICLTELGELLLLRATPDKFDVVSRITLRERQPGPPAAAVPGIGPSQLLRPPAWAAPILSHGLLYVRGKDRLVCLEAIPAARQ
ncbi:MAG: PQQ-like beta-propeller repeat protein [Planctomycetaceae bacterium]|nr:PQQ-like beta-propeller repeat protein [Planctomycetaceae bacterium]